MKLSAATKTLRKIPFTVIGSTPVSTLNNDHKITAFEAGGKKFQVVNHNIIKAFKQLETHIAKSKNHL